MNKKEQLKAIRPIDSRPLKKHLSVQEMVDPTSYTDFVRNIDQKKQEENGDKIGKNSTSGQPKP
jgi:hypothetical protein